MKGPRNFVTAADRAPRRSCAASWPRRGLATASSARKAASAPAADKTHRWIVDPLDGTTNFLHGIPHFAISIALEREGTSSPRSPTIRPTTNCSSPSGARARSSTISGCVSRRGQRLADAVVACGLPHYGRGDLALARREIAAAQQHFAGLRRFGAATLDLAWVAAGRFDAYWERDLSPWDIAAGVLLVREAGGFVSDHDGRDGILAKGEVAAGNDTMHRELLRLLKAAGKEPAKEKETS